MKNLLKTATLIFCFFQNYAQEISILEATNRWILLNNKIEKNEIFLTSYKPNKVRANSLVMSFANNKIVYDYETNAKAPASSAINLLDLDTNECSWTFDSLSQVLTMTIKGGYTSFEDFKFTREYKIEAVNDGFILMKVKEISYENLKLKPQNNIPVKKQVVVKKVVEKPQPKIQITENKIEKISADSIKVANIISKPVENEIVASNTVAITQPILAQPVIIAEPVKIDYFEQNKALFDITKRWILVRNKIERGDIYLTAYDESKLSINNLVLTLTNDGKFEYDYESDPKIRICLGVDFLDIDTDETSWVFDKENDIFTLTLKGGYASLDDFKFKRDYKVELFDDGFALRKVKEHFFNDFRKNVKAEKRKK